MGVTEQVGEKHHTRMIHFLQRDFEAVKKAIDHAQLPTVDAEVTMLPQTNTNLSGKEAEQMLRLMEMLDDCEDVQKVYTNADIPADIVNRM